jgi:hypothetical protein
VKRLFFILLVGLSAAAQVINCPSGFNGNTSGACSVATYYNGTSFASAQQIWVRGGQCFGTPCNNISGSQINFVPVGSTHNGFGMTYSPNQINVQAFTTTFTFIPAAWNFSFVIQNDTNTPGYENAAFSAGASCEAGFYQDDGVDPTPNYLFAMDFDNSGYNGGSYAYSTVQIYTQHQSPCQPNDGGTHWWPTTKLSTSPVPLNSPYNSQYTTTGDTYSATVTYDGSNLSLCLYDVTASNGSCSSATSGTGTYFQNTWTNVLIPSMVGATTAWVGFSSAVGSGSPQEPSEYPLYLNSWVYSVNTPTGTPSYTAWNANSTYNNGTTSTASPTYSITPGTYSSTQSVTLSDSTGSSNICYVLSSTTPTLFPQVDNNGGCASGTAYSGAISVSSTATLYAMAGTPWGTGPPSSLVAGTYTISGSAAATPTFSPAAGTYSGSQSVTISTSSSGAVICYNTTGSPHTNGSTGCSAGTLYSGPVAVSSSETLYAVAGGTSYTDSSAGSAAYTISGSPSRVPVASGKTKIQGKTISR